MSYYYFNKIADLMKIRNSSDLDNENKNNSKTEVGERNPLPNDAM